MSLLLRAYVAVSGLLFAVLLFAAFGNSRPTRFDEITVERVNVVDSAGRTRVLLAGGFPPRRASLAGLLFVNQDGIEAGGLVYAGTRDEDGTIHAGGILTFDQYRNDQVVALSYTHDGDRKSEGLTFRERPDTLSDRVKEFYRAFERAPDAAARDSIREYWLARIPRRELSSRRLFAGRAESGSSIVTLADRDGNVRLRLEVDSTGAASIAFLDTEGTVVRTIEP